MLPNDPPHNEDSEKPHLVDLFPSGELPKFSIRNYALSCRSKFGIQNSWPYAPSTLEACLKVGVSNPLPPFESPQDIRKPSGGSIVSERVLLEPPESAVIIEPSPGTLDDDDAGCSNLDPPVLADSFPTRIPQPESEAQALPEVNRTTANPAAKNNSPVKSLMGSQVCPVCQTFSSSSNTAMNAHMDGCLAGVGEASPIGSSPASPPSTSFKTRSKKLKSVAELYVDVTGAKVMALSKFSDQTPSLMNQKSQLMNKKRNESSSRPRRSLSKVYPGEESSPKKRSRKSLRRCSMPNQEDSSAAKWKSSSGPGPKSNLKRKALMKSACKKSARVEFEGSSSDDDDEHDDHESADNMELSGEEQEEPEAPVPEAQQDPAQADQEISIPDSQVPADEQQKETGDIDQDPIDLNLNVVPVSEDVAETSERPTLNASLDGNADFVQVFNAKLKINLADDGKGQKSPPAPMIRLMGKDLVVVNNQEPPPDSSRSSLQNAQSQIAQIPEIIVIDDDDDGPENQPPPGLMQQPAALGLGSTTPPPHAFRAFWMGPTNAGLNLNPPLAAMVHGPNQPNQSPTPNQLSPNPPLNLLK